MNRYEYDYKTGRPGYVPSEMVERISRAYCRGVQEMVHPTQPPEVIDKYVEMNWKIFVADTVRAVEAMRDLPGSIRGIIAEVIQEADRAHPYDLGSKVWNAAIEEMLK